MVSLVVAAAENGVIGRDNGLPWHLSADLRRFKAITVGHTVIMGRKTFDSIGKGLSGRRNLVVSRNPAFRPPGAERVPTLEAALVAAGPGCDVYIVGGAEIYRQALPLADRIYLTLVHARPEGDAHFFLPEGPEWTLESTEAHGADEKNDFPTEFRVYQRANRPAAPLPR